MTLVADSMEWPVKFKELKDIDDLLRCPICYEYINIAMAAPKCSHTYCSLCIRRYICYKTQCPTCTKPVSEPELIRNRVVDEIITAFSAVRTKLLELMNSAVTTEVVLNVGNEPQIQDSPDASCAKTTAKFNAEVQSSQSSKTSKATPRKEATRKSKSRRSKKSENKDDDWEPESAEFVVNKRSRRMKKNVKYKQDEGSDTDDGDVIICNDKDEDYLPAFATKSEEMSDDDGDFRTPHRSHPSSSKKSSVHRNNDDYRTHIRASPCGSPSTPKVPADISTPTSGMVRSSPCSQIEGKPIKMMKLVSPQSVKPKSHTSSSSSAAAARVPATLSIPSPPASTSSQRLPPPSQITSTQVSSSQAPATSLMKRVDCPVCGVSLLERNINLHLDSCLAGGPRADRLRSPPPSRKPMPKLVYNLLKDAELRKKLREVGLPTDGDRQTMIKRHQEFTLIYNTECDAPNPKSAAQIVKEMDLSNKMKTKSISMPNINKGKLVVQKGASESEVQTAQKTYIQEHKNQFAQLIAETKRRMREQKAAAEKARKEEAGEDNKENKHNLNQDTSVREESSLIGIDDTRSSSDSSMNCIDAGSSSHDTTRVDQEDSRLRDSQHGTEDREMCESRLPSLTSSRSPNSTNSVVTEMDSSKTDKTKLCDSIEMLTDCTKEGVIDSYMQHDSEVNTSKIVGSSLVESRYSDSSEDGYPTSDLYESCDLNKSVSLQRMQTDELALSDDGQMVDAGNSSQPADKTVIRPVISHEESSTIDTHPATSQGFLPDSIIHGMKVLTSSQKSSGSLHGSGSKSKRRAGAASQRHVELTSDADSRESAADMDLFPQIDDLLGDVLPSTQRRVEDECLSTVSVVSGGTSIRLSQSPRSTPCQSGSSSVSPVLGLLEEDSQQILSDEETDMPVLSPVFGASAPCGRYHLSQHTDSDQLVEPDHREPTSRSRRKRSRSTDDTIPAADQTNKRSRRARERDPPLEIPQRRLRTRKT